MKLKHTLIVGLLTLGLLGCPSGSNIQKAAKASDDVVAIVSAAQDLEIAAYHVDKVTPEEHIRIQLTFEKLAKADKDLNASLKASKDAKDVVAKLNVALDATSVTLQDGTLGVKNAEVKASILSAIQTTKIVLLQIQKDLK